MLHVNSQRLTMAGRGIGAFALATLAAAAGLLAAGPAHARNEFENGFEDEIGRILAHEAAYVGRSILSGGYYPVPPVYPAPVAGPAYYGPAYGGFYGPRTVVRYSDHGHRHHGYSCNSSHGRGKRYGYGYDRHRGNGHGGKDRGRGHQRGRDW